MSARDIDRACGLFQLPEVRRYLLEKSLTPRDAVAEMIAESINPAKASRYWRLATEEADFVGVVGLRPPSQASLALRAIGWRSLELVIALDPQFRGQGLATEAVEAVAAFAGEDGVTFALVGCVHANDQRSHKLMRRCGFEELGRAAGSQHPVLIYERAV